LVSLGVLIICFVFISLKLFYPQFQTFVLSFQSLVALLFFLEFLLHAVEAFVLL